MIQENFILNRQDLIPGGMSTRFRANGIVALPGCEKPIVARIYDLAADGMSFLHVNDQGIAASETVMDILIFDAQSDDEFLISQIKGCVKSKELIADPENKAPIWRFSVEFADLDFEHRQVLETCLSLVLNRYLD